METNEKGLERVDGNFESHDLDLVAEELYGGNNCNCTHHNSTSGCGHSTGQLEVAAM